MLCTPAQLTTASVAKMCVCRPRLSIIVITPYRLHCKQHAHVKDAHLKDAGCRLRWGPCTAVLQGSFPRALKSAMSPAYGAHSPCIVHPLGATISSARLLSLLLAILNACVFVDRLLQLIKCTHVKCQAGALRCQRACSDRSAVPVLRLSCPSSI